MAESEAAQAMASLKSQRQSKNAAPPGSGSQKQEAGNGPNNA